jgi:predicted flap endonuclease-1-like 5' DNA nuclease
VNHADLFRIKGIGSEFSDLLEASGVDSVPELAQRVPANLAAKLAEVNAETNLTRRVPTESEVADWIEQAKGLPKVVSH